MRRFASTGAALSWMVRTTLRHVLWWWVAFDIPKSLACNSALLFVEKLAPREL
jgi:hypothetical protein